MDDEPAMRHWWDHIGRDAHEAWCAAAKGEGAISEAMIRSIDSVTAEAGAWLILRKTAWTPIDPGHPDRDLSPSFKAFIQRRCQR